jgi:hypothetical protein
MKDVWKHSTKQPTSEREKITKKKTDRQGRDIQTNEQKKVDNNKNNKQTNKKKNCVKLSTATDNVVVA